MYALIYSKFGKADNLKWVSDWPDPELDDNSILIESFAGGVNPKDVLLRKGMFSKTLARDPLPRVSGMDVAGKVIQVGAKVFNIKPGDCVYAMTNHFAGGLHCEFAKLNANEFALAPKNIPVESAATVPLAAQTALQALRDCAQLKPGQKILINGASGGVGHFAVQIANVLGAEVHGVCGAKNLNFVKSLGADKVYNYANQKLKNIDERFDIVFDVFGKLSRSDFKHQLTKNGIYVSTVPKLVNFWGELLARLKISKATRLVEVKSCSNDLNLIRDWIEAGSVTPFVEKVFPVQRAAEAHRHIESRHTKGKICLSFK